MNSGPVTVNNNSSNNKLPKNRFDRKTPTDSGRIKSKPWMCKEIEGVRVLCELG